MAQAIDEGIPKLRIEEAAARTQARIDSGRQPVIGVNKYRPTPTSRSRCSRSTTPRVRAQQLEQAAAAARRARRATPCRTALDALTTPPRRSGGALDGNLLALAVDAARAQGHRRRDLRRAGEGLRAAHRPDPYDLRRVPRRGGRAPSRSSAARALADAVRARPRAAGRASWSPRWARTATTAARR